MAVAIFSDYPKFVRNLSSAVASIVGDRVRRELILINMKQEHILAKIDDLIIAAQDISSQAAEHRVVVDEAIATIRELIADAGVEDPRLEEVLASLAESSTALDSATTDLAAADDVAPEEPPADPVEGDAA